jgi:hypothetical protein
MHRTLALLCASTLVACSSSGGGSAAASLDCAWLAGNNCWKTTVSQADSCLPPSAEQGTLSADMRSCTYASGTVVAFDSPLVLPVADDLLWSFTLTSAGQPCLRYQDTSDASFKLTVQGMTFTEGAVGFGLNVTCPNGMSFSNGNALDLLGCASDSGFLGGLPGKAWSSSDTSVSFELINGSSSAAGQSVFSCRRP